MMITALVVDDHAIVRQGCRSLLEDEGNCEVLEASSTLSGYRLFLRRRPNVVVLDLALHGNGLAGLSLLRRIRARAPGTPILVFSMHADPLIASRALEAGATGYLSKDAPASDLLEAFDKVRRGFPYINHGLATRVAFLSARGRPGAVAELTPRELQTVSLLAEGKAYGQIAEELGVSYKTVANTCSQLKVKLGATNLAELIHCAIRYIATSPTPIAAAEPR